MLGDEGNASTAGVPPPSSDGAKALSHAVQTREAQREEPEPSRSGVTPPTDNASAAASSSTQNSKTRRGTKWLASGTNTQNIDATAPSGKSRKTEHESEDTVTGANAFTFKRKKETVSGANPPTRRPRTSVTVETVNTIKTTLTAHNWAELH